MVYERVQSEKREDFYFSTPRNPANTPKPRGVYFQAVPGGKMVAYEYTTEPDKELKKHEGFVREFSNLIIALGVQDVFALTVCSFAQSRLTEIEMPDAVSTVLLRDDSWLPKGKETTATATDWYAGSEYIDKARNASKCPGPIMLACMTTRTGTHHGLHCRATRGSHTTRSIDPFKDEIWVDDMLLEKGTVSHAMMAKALEFTISA